MPRHFSPALCRKRAFTLVETLITLAIFGVTAIGMIELYLFGLRLNSMVNVKLQATEGARHAMSILATDIRDAGIVYVGNGDASSFTNSAFDAPQEGNALEIYPSKTNLNDYIIYYLDSSDGQLKRLESNQAAPTIIAGSVTNTVVFDSEDYAGNVLSNSYNNRVIGITLQFYQLDNPMLKFAPGQVYDAFQLQTKVTRRALE